MGDRDGKPPTPVANGHRPPSDNASLPEVRQPSVALPGIVKPKGTPKAAGNRLPPPTRARAARLVAAPRVAQSPNTRHAADLDEATLVDGTKVLSPPPPPDTAPRRRPQAERTQIVIPLPPPDLEPRSRSSSPMIESDSLAQTAGEIVVGRGRAGRTRAPRAAVVVQGARRRQIAIGVLGLAVIAAIAGTGIGFSTISSSGVPPVIVPGMARTEPAKSTELAKSTESAPRAEQAVEPAPRRAIVEEVPVAAPAPEPAPAEAARPEPASEPDEIAGSRVDRMPVARPLRQRTIAPSSAVGIRHKTTHSAKASKQARSPRTLSYDPDALFLKRP
ncbi:MAG TPA: hypothetical protein VFD36_19480 [Kofleriaceae bacterium]|nr:hypothetical protein [Kofleriaceae bacterium]